MEEEIGEKMEIQIEKTSRTLELVLGIVGGVFGLLGGIFALVFIPELGFSAILA